MRYEPRGEHGIKKKSGERNLPCKFMDGDN